MRRIITISEFERSEKQTREFILEQNIISPSKGEKAINDLTRHLSYCLIKNGITGRRFLEFRNDYLNDSIFDVKFLVDTGEHFWVEKVATNYQKLAKDLFLSRPVGLGSPNSACGEAEFMLLCLSPLCSKPTRGDIKLDLSGNEFIIELKGDQPRVTSSMPGNYFRRKTLELCDKFRVEPNISLRGNIIGVQLTSEGLIKEHWKSQFDKLCPDKRIQFLSEWLKLTGTFNEEESISSSKNILQKDDYIDTTLLKKEIVKYFFKHQVSVRHEFSNMAFFKRDTVKIITNDVDKFFKMVDENKVIPDSDYFRINQPANLAWYINV